MKSKTTLPPNHLKAEDIAIGKCYKTFSMGINFKVELLELVPPFHVKVKYLEVINIEFERQAEFLKKTAAGKLTDEHNVGEIQINYLENL